MYISVLTHQFHITKGGYKTTVSHTRMSVYFVPLEIQNRLPLNYMYMYMLHLIISPLRAYVPFIKKKVDGKDQNDLQMTIISKQ